MPSPVAFGSVVRVSLLDPQGRNPKSRPAVVISRDEEIAEEGEVWVVGITGQPGREPALEVPLQYDPQGKCRTGLRKPSFALCSWLAKVRVDAIDRCAGHLPAAAMVEIAKRVEEVRRGAAEPPAAEPE